MEQISPCTTVKPCSRAQELQVLNPQAQLLKPSSPRASVLPQEKPPHSEALTLQIESNPHSPQLEKNQSSSEDPAQLKNKYNYF